MRPPKLVTPLLLFGAFLIPSLADATPAWRPSLDESGFASGGGDLSLTLSARAERSDLGEGVSGFVALAVPLDRLAAPKRVATSGDEGSNEAPGGASAEAPQAKDERP